MINIIYWKTIMRCNENGLKISGETKRVMEKFIDKYSEDKELQKDLQKKVK